MRMKVIVKLLRSNRKSRRRVLLTLVGVISSDLNRSSFTTSLCDGVLLSAILIFFQVSPSNLPAAFFWYHHISAACYRIWSSFFIVQSSASYVITGHMGAFINCILSSFRIPRSFLIVSSYILALLALPILALMSSVSIVLRSKKLLTDSRVIVA